MAEYVLLGEKLGHSHSPRIHRLLGGYDYELVELGASEFDAYLKLRPFRGANVTIPYKRRAFELCDHVSAEARAVGSVNTLVVRDGALHGHNTDVAGFREMVRRAGVAPRGLRTAVLGGTGGAGRMACAALAGMGAASVVSVSRQGPVDCDALYRDHQDVELLVNATPIGMVPRQGIAPVDLARLPRVRCVLDMVYNPNKTALLLDAEARGVRTENGLSMLVAQAARAVELFTGGFVDREAVGACRRTIRRERLNLVLVGMPGSGKSKIGAACAARMGRPFVDTDCEIERRAGQSIPQIFEEQGEARFRALESEVLRAVMEAGGQVVATGGGAVTRPENVREMRGNGAVCWLRRPVEALAMGGRPLSKDRESLLKMERARAPLYAAAADYEVNNAGAAMDAARAVMEGFDEAAGD